MTAQLPSKARLEKIASWRETYGAGHNVMLPAEEAEALARFALTAHEQEPTPNHIGSKNALDAIVTFIKSSSNPTLSDYNSVSERLFADNCQSLSSHVIEYITHIGEELEDLRHDAANPTPVPAVPDEISTTDAIRIMNGRVITMSVHTAYKNGWNACRAAMLNGGKS